MLKDEGPAGRKKKERKEPAGQPWLHRKNITCDVVPMPLSRLLLLCCRARTQCPGFSARTSPALCPQRPLLTLMLCCCCFLCAVPWFQRKNITCDVFSVDGDHTYESALTDFMNVLKAGDWGDKRGTAGASTWALQRHRCQLLSAGYRRDCSSP